MADIQSLLGDAYKEGMTVDEINEALAERELVDKSQYAGYVPKALLDKANTEAADYKKKWRAAATEQEKRDADEKEKQEQLEAELAGLRKESKVAGYEKNYLAMNYDPSDARTLAEAMYDGDMDTVFNLQKKHDEAVQKSVKAQMLKDMPNPPAGNETIVDYTKQIAEAQASGNMALMSALIRQQAAANANKK